MKTIEKPVDDLRERFILWLASKPADEVYRWENAHYCPCGKFIHEELKYKVKNWLLPFITHSFIKPECIGEVSEVWARWNRVASEFPRTYGALLQRVRDI